MVRGYIANNVSLEDIMGAEMIFYAANSCWWTHDPKDLSVLPSSLPCGPRGEVLLQTSDVEGFMHAAMGNPSHYGCFGIKAFLAAHHQNCFLSKDMTRHWSFPRWDDYNTLLECQQAAKSPESKFLEEK